MRNITKNIQFQIDGTPMDFRLTKLDAFSGAELLRMLAGIPAGGGDAGEAHRRHRQHGQGKGLPANGEQGLLASPPAHAGGSRDHP